MKPDHENVDRLPKIDGKAPRNDHMNAHNAGAFQERTPVRHPDQFEATSGRSLVKIIHIKLCVQFQGRSTFVRPIERLMSRQDRRHNENCRRPTIRTKFFGEARDYSAKREKRRLRINRPGAIALDRFVP